jgi:hypothetical protein
MKTFLAILIFALSTQATASVIPYKTSLAFLATRYRAYHTCNCMFTMKMSEEYCTSYSKIEPQIFTVVIDKANKSVSSGIMGMDFKPSVAKFAGERTGCDIVNQ